MPSVLAQVWGYLLLVGAAAAMAGGTAGLFGRRLSAVLRYSVILQAGYVALGVSAGLLAAGSGGFQAAVFQVIAAGAALTLLWLSARAIEAAAGDAAPVAQEAPLPAWAVFGLGLSCASLAGLPPLGGLPAKTAILFAGLRNPAPLWGVTMGAAALSVVALWAYAGLVLPMILRRVGAEGAAASVRLRVAVDALIAVIIVLGLVPYLGFAIGGAVAGRP